MPETVQSDQDVIVWINKNKTSSDGDEWRVVKQTAAKEVFTVEEDGTTTITGSLERSGAHVVRNHTAGDGTIASFRRNAGVVLKVGYSSTEGALIETTSSAELDINFRSAGDVIVVADADDDSGTLGRGVFVRDSGGNGVVVFSLGQATFYDSSGNIEVQLSSDAGLDRDSRMDFGGGDSLRGHVKVFADTTNTKQAILEMQDQDGTTYYLWVDTAGKLRIDTTDPGGSDTPASSTVVGTQ